MENEQKPKAPRTLREKYTIERENLYAARESMTSALNELLAGEATASYSIGNRSTSIARSNLKDLQDAIRKVDQRIDELEALLSGRAPRGVTSHSFTQPARVFWWL